MAYTTVRKLDPVVSAHKRDDTAVEAEASAVVSELTRLGFRPVGSVDLTGAGFHRIASYMISSSRTTIAIVAHPVTTFVSLFGGRVFSTTDRSLSAVAFFELRQVEPETPITRLWRVHEAGLAKIGGYGAQPERLSPERAVDIALEVDRLLRVHADSRAELFGDVARGLRMDRGNQPVVDDRRADKRIRRWLDTTADPIRV